MMLHTPMTQKEFTIESNRRNGKRETKQFLHDELHQFTTADIIGYHPNLGIYIRENDSITLYLWCASTRNFIILPAVSYGIKLKEAKAS